MEHITKKDHRYHFFALLQVGTPRLVCDALLGHVMERTLYIGRDFPLPYSEATHK
jgi:hypothetical protein